MTSNDIERFDHCYRSFGHSARTPTRLRKHRQPIPNSSASFRSNIEHVEDFVICWSYIVHFSVDPDTSNPSYHFPIMLTTSTIHILAIFMQRTSPRGASRCFATFLRFLRFYRTHATKDSLHFDLLSLTLPRLVFVVLYRLSLRPWSPYVFFCLIFYTCPLCFLVPLFLNTLNPCIIYN